MRPVYAIFTKIVQFAFNTSCSFVFLFIYKGRFAEKQGGMWGRIFAGTNMLGRWNVQLKAKSGDFQEFVISSFIRSQDDLWSLEHSSCGFCWSFFCAETIVGLLLCFLQTMGLSTVWTAFVWWFVREAVESSETSGASFSTQTTWLRFAFDHHSLSFAFDFCYAIEGWMCVCCWGRERWNFAKTKNRITNDSCAADDAALLVQAAY